MKKSRSIAIVIGLLFVVIVAIWFLRREPDFTITTKDCPTGYFQVICRTQMQEEPYYCLFAEVKNIGELVQGLQGMSNVFEIQPGENLCAFGMEGKRVAVLVCSIDENKKGKIRAFKLLKNTTAGETDLAIYLETKGNYFAAGPETIALAEAFERMDGQQEHYIENVYAYVNDYPYDYSVLEMDGGSSAMPFRNTDDILEHGSAVCLDKAYLLAAMLRCQEVPCRVIIGQLKEADGTTNGHAWNEIWLEGNWVPCDVTNSWEIGMLENVEYRSVAVR